MDISFWLQRWQQGQIGFHQSEASPYLVQYWQEFIQEPIPVLVPLCGKSLDMLWLRQQGHTIIGVEAVGQAVSEFFSENHLEVNRKSIADFEVWSNEGIEIFQGDFFHFTKENIGTDVCVYDRAAMIALPENMRSSYVSHVSQLLPSKSKMFLVTMVYPQDKMDGPPFSVSEEVVSNLYGKEYEILDKKQFDILQEHSFKERGIDYLYEEIYFLERR